MEDILGMNYTKKINFMLYIQYKLKDDLVDDDRYDVIVQSHGSFYKIKYHENDDEKNYEIVEVKNNETRQMLYDYFWMDKQLINYYLLSPEAVYFEENIQDYHKMHFDILSNDGTRGIIFFKQNMIEVSHQDLYDIFEDLEDHTLSEIIDYYQKEENDLNNYFKEAIEDGYEL